MHQLLIGSGVIALEVVLTIAVFIWAARCLNEESTCSE